MPSRKENLFLSGCQISLLEGKKVLGFRGPWYNGTRIFEQQPTHGLLPSENKETACVKPCDSLLGKVVEELAFLRAHDCSRNKYTLYKVN